MNSFSDDGSLPSLDKCSEFVFSDNFEVLGKLGSGGFSNVYKVEHKVDKGVYAIKCVEYNSYADREVEALAKLNHPNIIRYKMCLLTVNDDRDSCKLSSESASTDDGTQFTKDSLRLPVQDLNVSAVVSWRTESDESGGDSSYTPTLSTAVTTESTSSDNPDNSGSQVPLDSNSANDQQEPEHDSSKSPSGEASESREDRESRQTPVPVQEQGIIESDIAKIKDGKSIEDGSKSSSRKLYIMMEFCKGGTLNTWIYQRNYENVERSEEEALSIFHQIVSGMKYVHSKNIIHRDLKPDNIFFGNDENVKIADFGLATSASNGDPIQRTKHIGTETYMSPEQNCQTDYNEKTDIFPLGLIWFELLWRMSTGTERIKKLSELRNQTFPEGFYEKYTTQHKYIKQMLSKDPKERPDAETLENILKEYFPLGPSDSIRKSETWNFSALCSSF